MNWEFAVFTLIALAMHFAAFFAPGGGAESEGGGGETLVSLSGSSAQLEMLVDTWKRPPDVEMVDTFPPVEIAELPVEFDMHGDMEVLATLAPQIDRPKAPTSDTFSAPTITGLDAPRLDREESYPAEISPGSRLSQPMSVSTPSAPEAPLETQVSDQKGMSLPVSRPDSIAQNYPEPERTQPAAIEQNRQIAAGAGDNADAGSAIEPTIATISSGEKARLEQIWGGQIRRAIERRKRYPRKAQSRGDTGIARVVVTVNLSGRLVGHSLVGSTGSGILDNAAMSAITSVGQFPQAPNGLAGGQFTFRFNIVFE